MFDLYPQSGIRPSLLNPIDRSLFDGLLEAGFMLQLVPVLIDIYCDVHHGNSFTVHQANFVPKAYIRNIDTSKMETIVLDEKEAKKGSFHYKMTFDGEKKQLSHVAGSEYTGNESAAKEHEYFACAMIVRAPEMREAIEKK